MTQTDDPEWNSLLESAFVAVLEGADEGFIVFDKDGTCRMIGRRIGEIFGIDPGAHVGRSRHDVLSLLSKACEEPDAFLQSVGANDLGAPPQSFAEIELLRPMPRQIVWTTFPVVRDEIAWGRVGIVRDVTRERSAERSLKQLQARLDDLALFDVLTRVPNAKKFRDDAGREHGRSTRAWDSYAILRIDIDGMQELNHDLGIPVGDTVLEKVADCLNGARRHYDMLARWEGDEFAVLLPGADAVAARVAADRMIRAVSTHNFQLADDKRISICIGAAVWVPPTSETWEDVMRRAGVALVQARAAGKGRYKEGES